MKSDIKSSSNLILEKIQYNDFFILRNLMTIRKAIYVYRTQQQFFWLMLAVLTHLNHRFNMPLNIRNSLI
jgi:hypothetical protein